MSCTIIVGGFFGDEGKGKIVAHIAYHDKPTIISRGGVGPNAGHTVKDGRKRIWRPDGPVRVYLSGCPPVYRDRRPCRSHGF